MIMPALDIVVGRQPIFDRDRSVFGYELLFRTLSGPSAAEAAGSLGDQMTADVIFTSVTIGLDRLVGNKMLSLQCEPRSPHRRGADPAPASANGGGDRRVGVPTSGRARRMPRGCATKVSPSPSMT